MEPVEVECYAGYRSDETPRNFIYRGQRKEIAEVIDRWYQGARDPEWPIADYFRVRTTEGHLYLLRHDREGDRWYLVLQSNGLQTGQEESRR